jgi:murein DD-endopeptidase MepM/ murein hydrolase activator NlpD
MHLTRRLALVVILCVALHSLIPRPAAADPIPDPVGVWPLLPVPEVVAGFDPPDSPWGAGHRGVDLGGSPGQRVRAALAGRVAYAAALAGRGVVVVVHGDTRTTYEPVASEVEVGEVVRAGETLGRLQQLGSHCFPRACLHWGWLRGTTYLNPLGLVGARPVRLLPFGGTSGPALGVTPRWFSGSWMGLLVGPPQPVSGDMGVELRRG